jgi:hypothetical protein
MVQTDKQFLRLLAWGILQLAILGIGASGFPLWAHHPFPRESLALQEMLVGQAIILAGLFPVLMDRPRDVVIATALMIPMDQLAGLLSNSPQISIWSGFGCLTLWLVGLGGWAVFLKESGRQTLVTGLAMLLLIGGGILDYLRWETAATNGQSSAFLPISLLPHLYWGVKGPSARLWIQAGMPLAALTVTRTIQLVTAGRSPSSTSLHSPS